MGESVLCATVFTRFTVISRLCRYHCVAWCPFKFKINHFLLVGTTKVVIFSFFYVPFLWRSFRCNIAATTLSFAAWYVLWVGMWLSFCSFDLAPLVLKLCCSKPHNSSKCVISFSILWPVFVANYKTRTGPDQRTGLSKNADWPRGG